MNWPNRLTLLRVLLVPVMVGLMYAPCERGPVWALAVFVIAAVTDFLDGFIARKRNIVTVFGQFLDPVADKMLVMSAFVMLSARGLMPAWAAALVLARDLLIDSLRMVAAKEGFVLAAGIWGKVKTIIQMATVAILFLSAVMPELSAFSKWMIGLTVISTLWSGIDYFYRHKAIYPHGRKEENP